jgi:hypothetical protein
MGEKTVEGVDSKPVAENINMEKKSTASKGRNPYGTIECARLR